jgi:hypothetical protein
MLLDRHPPGKVAHPATVRADSLVDYPDPAKFTGRIHWVQLDIGEDDHDHLITPEERLRVAMTRQ